ncbi:MAG: N-acetyl-gamma-glutamyl-phosphate reductase [Rhodospirillaceae bacterium]
MTFRIFIDGEEGTTGLQIRERLEDRPEFDFIRLSAERRKDAAARRDALNAADVAILCLPDDAAREAAAMTENPETRLIDASTAHRVAEGWTYGFPELSAGHADVVAASRRVSNPGCYPTGAIALIRPLVAAGLLPPSYPVAVNAVSGYSGGGKSLIARMEDTGADKPIDSAYFLYALGLEHKHVAEMQMHGTLERRPIFTPAVGRFRQGMIVQVPLHLSLMAAHASVDLIRETLEGWYAGSRFVSVAGEEETASRLVLLDPEELNNTNRLRLFVFGNQKRDHAVLAAQLDNLGKGASGAAVQNMNLMLGLDEAAGLEQRVLH